MSLFKACDWWSTNCGSDEEFDKGCLAVANIDNSLQKLEKIITGSHAGVLRIYKPQPVKQEDGTYSSFSANDLLLEAQLKSPIIFLGVGVLASSSSSLQLAVLHPFKLSIYSVTAVEGSAEHGTQIKLSLLYEHTLQRHAFSLIVGKFGGIQGKDMMCVQSLDGTLSFFEQERFSFSRFLPKNLIPGPLTYVSKTDSFVTVNGFSIESYRFQSLASASEDSNENENVTFKGKKVAPEWTFTLPDNALDITTVEDKTSPSLVILGERFITALNCHGATKYIKKFSFTPRCFTCYRTDVDGFLIILLVTSNQTLLIFHETELKWAAQLTFSPVCLSRAFFLNTKGILTLLSEQGALSCCYLGTEPSLFVSPVSEPKEIDFKEAEDEMNRLRKVIKSSNQSLLGTQKLGNEISLSINVSHHVSSSIEENDPEETRSKNSGPVPSVTVKVSLKCRTVVHDVRLMLYVEAPLKVSQHVFVFGSVMDDSHAIVSVAPNSPSVPVSLKITAHAAYTNSYGAPRIVVGNALLPFGVVAKICSPAKDGDAKVTIDINKKIVLLSEMFSDLVSDGSTYPGGTMGIEYHSGHIVTILPSKTSQRYRLQSDHFSSLWLTVSELVRRLHHKYRKEPDNEKLKCSYTSPLPLKEYFKVIEEHFTNRQVVQDVENLVAHRSVQFRVVQKRLLTKLKDSTPSPLNNLDTLLEATHRQIMSLTETMDKHLKELENSTCALNCATNLILMLVRLSVELSEDEFLFLTSCFSPVIEKDSPQGWEERVNVSLVYLLKNGFGKGSHDTKFPDAHLDVPKDISRLKKHITLVLDKILKNIPMTLAEALPNMNESINQSPDEDELTIPDMSKFVDTASPRPASATTSKHNEDASNGNSDASLSNLQESTAFDELDDDEEEIII